MSVKKNRVLVGLSGGVDSSVSAALLLEQGYEVIGAFMKNWSSCEWRSERRDALRVAAQLDIPFITLDFEKHYRRAVVDDLFAEYAAGRTPNPDVLCNKYIKFDLFVRAADRLGCAYVATGHYARAEGTHLLTGLDHDKDQSYFLWAVPPPVLPRVLFPLGDMNKLEVRALARARGLAVADKKDSTGICFVGEVDIKEFLQTRIADEPGAVVTTVGEVVGEHRGVAFFTIGQRHGLHVGGGTPYYVVDKKPATRELIVASNFHPALYRSELTASQVNWFRPPSGILPCQARIRYRQPLTDCIVSPDRRVVFAAPQRAVTPGQSVVFYDGEEVLGGGIIDSYQS